MRGFINHAHVLNMWGNFPWPEVLSKSPFSPFRGSLYTIARENAVTRGRKSARTKPKSRGQVES